MNQDEGVKLLDNLNRLKMEIGLPQRADTKILIQDTKIKEYDQQIQAVSELIDRETVDLMDYVSMKTARIEALMVMLCTAYERKQFAINEKASLEKSLKPIYPNPRMPQDEGVPAINVGIDTGSQPSITTPPFKMPISAKNPGFRCSLPEIRDTTDYDSCTGPDDSDIPQDKRKESPGSATEEALPPRRSGKNLQT